MALSLEQFTQAVVACGAMPADELRALLDSLPPEKRPADAQQLARALVAAGKLTKYQAAQIYTGNAKELVFGQYLLLDELGKGGMGQVFKACHRVMQRTVALKMLSPTAVKSPETVQRFRREVRAAARLNHPNIVTSFDADQAGGVHFLVMECVEGQDLESLCKKNGQLPVADALNYVAQVAAGLAYAHGQGVIHRDIKPHNLLLDRSGAVKILDMGLARFDDGTSGESSLEGLTQTGVVMGTVDYMAPEQAENTHQADQRSDIYSLGCTLFRLLAGRTPYAGDTLMAKLIAHANKPLPQLREERDDISPDLEAVVQRMMAKLPADRYARMEEVLVDLRACATGARVVHARAAGGSAPDAQLNDFLAGLSQPAATSVNRSGTQVAQPGATLSVPVAPAKSAEGKSAQSQTRLRNSRLFAAGGGIAILLLVGIGLALRNSDERPAKLPVEPNVPISGTTVNPPVSELANSAEPQRIADAEAALAPLLSKAALRETDPIALRDELRAFQVQHSGTPSAVKATDLLGPALSRIASPLDGLEASQLPSDTRQFWQALGRSVPRELVAVLGEHRGRTWGAMDSAQVSPDGKWIATGSGGFVQLWDATTLAPVSIFRGNGHSVFALAFSPDGTRLAFSDGVGPVRLGSLQDGQFQQLAALEGHPSNVFYMAFSPDGTLLAYSSANQVWLWDLQTPQPNVLHTIELPATSTHRINFSGNSQRLAMWNGDHLTHVWDVARPTPQPRCRLSVPNDVLWSVAWTPDGARLATAYSSGRGSLWTVGTDPPVENMLRRHATSQVAISSDGRTMAFGCTGDGVLVTWDIGDAEPRLVARDKPQSSRIRAVAFSGDDKQLLTSGDDGQFCVSDVATLELLHTMPGALVHAGQSGQVLLLNRPSSLHVFYLATAEHVEPSTAPFFLRAAISPDCGVLATVSAGGQISLWDLPTGKLLHPPIALPGAIVSLAFAPDGKQLAAGSLKHQILLIEVATGQVRQLPNAGTVRTVVFSPQGDLLASAEQADGVRLWDVAKGAVLMQLAVKANPSAVAFSADGKQFAHNGADGQVRVRDTATGRQLHLLPGYGDIRSLAFAYDGAIVAHKNYNQIALSPDGQLQAVIVGPEIEIHDLRAKRLLHKIALFGAPVAVAFAADGRHLAVVNGNGTLYFLRLFPRGSRLYTQLDAAWLQAVAKMTPEDQVQAVFAELQRRNPGFDDPLKHDVRGGAVTRLEFLVDNVEDISPVRALTGLKQLVLNAHFGKSKFRDLWPLHGMPLEYLDCGNNPIEDLGALAGMPLKTLIARNTQIGSLEPIRTSPLTNLICGSPRLREIAALQGMQLQRLNISSSPVEDLSPLSGMPLVNLTVINTRVRNFVPLGRLPLQALRTDLVPELSTPALMQHATLKTLNGKPVAEFWQEFEARPKPFTNSIGMQLIKILAGTFQMGSPTTELHRRDNEGPQHEVTLTRPFYLGLSEVTQEQYEQIMGPWPGSGGPTRPALGMTWLDAVAFCGKLSAREEERQAGRRYRLPTEAEWEYACRAGTSTAYYFGDDPNLHYENGWFHGNDEGQVHPVGQFAPNSWGLFDMAGNVWEFCADHYLADFYQRSPAVDPLAIGPNDFRVIRGGARNNPASESRSACRWPNHPYNGGHGNVGFRVACDLATKPK